MKDFSHFQKLDYVVEFIHVNHNHLPCEKDFELRGRYFCFCPSVPLVNRLWQQRLACAPQDDLLEKDRLFEQVIEMGEALTTQKQIEQLLSNIISSISRLTGAERAALFIRGKDAKTLDMAASRNLTQESLNEEAFRETIERIRAATQDQRGGSEGIMDIHRLIARVAPTLLTVLISGETAVRLGLKRTTPINRMKKLGIKLERSPAEGA
jgi:transcriptional regulator with GAF, ATPase, and Fis domain